MRRLHGAKVWVYHVGPVSLLWCSHCGPMGASEGWPDENMVRDHITAHDEEKQ